ncbi:MAG: hypothetical protein V3R25_09990 [Nitrosomonadaceae bacterium]
MKTIDLIKLLNEISESDLSEGSDINDHPCAIAAKELESSMREVSRMAVSLWKNNYIAESPGFELLDNPSGIMTQIDNMTTGLIKHGRSLRDSDLRALMDLSMCSDPWPVEDAGVNQETIVDILNREAENRGYTDWIQAYHHLEV